VTETSGEKVGEMENMGIGNKGVEEGNIGREGEIVREM
jgi:hypothetical protein